MRLAIEDIAYISRAWGSDVANMYIHINLRNVITHPYALISMMVVVNRYCVNHTIAPMSLKQPLGIWVNNSDGYANDYDITKPNTKNNDMCIAHISTKVECTQPTTSLTRLVVFDMSYFSQTNPTSLGLQWNNRTWLRRILFGLIEATESNYSALFQ